MIWAPSTKKLGLWVLVSAIPCRCWAKCWPVLRPTAFGDWEYTVGNYYKGRERSFVGCKKAIRKLLKPAKK